MRQTRVQGVGRVQVVDLEDPGKAHDQVKAVAFLASLVSGLAWLLQDDFSNSPDALDSRLVRPSGPRLDLLPAACEDGDFDRRRLLQPHFGQTLKVKRVGVL